MTITALNATQKEAVLHNGSPLLILAGAGTGKTRVLTEKIINLIDTYIADARDILAVTFTNKAAGEMKHRISSRIGDAAQNIWMGTFHGIAARILKRHPEIVGLTTEFTIVDPDDCLRLLKQITSDLNIDPKEYPPKNYQYQIERLKDKALLPQDLHDGHIAIQKLPFLLKIYTIYQNRLQDLNVADFGDLLLYNLKIFEKSPETLQYYQNKFRHILVDEYQDTNNAQYQWLLKLSDKYKNICVVGDDDQSIYSWRGAVVANILRFEKDFANTKIVRLEQNYRSTSNILKAASGLIKNNPNRHSKTLWTEGDKGNKIKLLNFSNDRQEAEEISRIIIDLHLKQKVNLNDIAILVRAGYQTRSFEESFIQNAVPYRIIGGLKFYDRREIKDSIAYLRIVNNSSDDLALERIINLPKRGLGSAGLKILMQRARDKKCSLLTAVKRSVAENLLKGKAKLAIKDLIENIESWTGLLSQTSVSNLAQQILQESGYILMLKNEKTPEAATRLENIEEFINSLDDFDSLGAFLEHVSLVNADNSSNSDELVNIMTVHGAKGLEFDSVFIPGLEEGIFPSGRAAAEKNGLEEERRLLYVAITRAKKSLYLSFANYRFMFGNLQPCIPSSFIAELPKEVIESNAGENFYEEFTQSDFTQRKFQDHSKDSFQEYRVEKEKSLINKRIFHQKFGYGKVMEIDGEKLKISFEKGGIKMLMKNFIEIV